MYSALWVADYILGKSRGALTLIHVLKLTYLAHGYTLGILDKPLIIDKVEAWKHGPVIPTIYEAFSEYGKGIIPSLYYCGTKLSSPEIKERVDFLGKKFSKEEKEIVDSIVDLYKDWEAGQLITLTHESGTPWSKHHIKGVPNIIIPDASTKEYYTRLVNERRK